MDARFSSSPIVPGEPWRSRPSPTAQARSDHTRPGRNPRLDLFLISFLLLFFELACIRWFGSTVIFLTFFTNLVLMACFLGMSVGCLAAGRKTDYLQAVLPLTLLAVVLALGVLWAYNHFERLTIAVDRRPSPQQVFFGTETRAVDPAHFVDPDRGRSPGSSSRSSR